MDLAETSLPASERAQPITTLERVLCWSAILLLTLYPFSQRYQVPAILGALLVTTALAWARQFVLATSAGLLAMLGVFGFTYVIGVSPVAFGLGFACLFLLTRQVLWMRPALDWLVKGRIDKGTVGLCVAIIVCAAVALVLWHTLMHPNLEDLYRQFRLREFPAALVLIGGLVFSSANAVAEEVMYRGFVMHLLETTVSWRWALPLQAISFGALHMHGFPRGLVGVGLATIYGLMMGAVRVRANGLLMPWLAHIFTDMTIVAILLLAMH